MNWDSLLVRLALASFELAVTAVVVAFAIRLFRVRSARVRSFLWFLVLLKPLVILSGITPLALTPTGFLAGFLSPDRPFHGSSGANAGELAQTIPIAPWIAYVWMFGVSVFLGRMLNDTLRLRRILRRRAPLAGPVRQLYRSAADDLGILKPPRASSTRDLDSPALVGILRPVVFIPSWLAEQGDVARLRWAFKHELMHFKSRDTWTGLVRQITETLFFFHPLAWWSGARWEQERELACDHSLVKDHGEARIYAEVLFGIVEQALSRGQRRLVSGAYATHTQIGKRITALLGDRRSPEVRKRTLVSVTAFFMVSLSVGIAEVGTAPLWNRSPDVVCLPNDAESCGAAEIHLTILCPAEPGSDLCNVSPRVAGALEVATELESGARSVLPGVVRCWEGMPGEDAERCFVVVCAPKNIR